MSKSVVIKNIARLEKNVTVAATIYDTLEVPVAFSRFQTIISANSTKTLYVEDLFIPKWAFSCNGNVIVTALTPDGEAYSPEKNQTIKIIPCYYVGGVNYAIKKTIQSPWILGVLLMVTFTLVLGVARRKLFRN